jgi:hypothetical protein
MISLIYNYKTSLLKYLNPPVKLQIWGNKNWSEIINKKIIMLPMKIHMIKIIMSRDQMKTRKRMIII